MHGLIEGKALGCEKGYEMWEELGFYQGFASTWRTFLSRHGSNSDEYVIKFLPHLELLSEPCISFFF
jgi:hypothetical protein